MNLWKDIRFGGRMLRKSPGFTATAVFTLGAGIGVTVAIYSVVNAMLWKPVNLPYLENLVMVLEEGDQGIDSWEAVTPADLADIRQASTALENIASWEGGLASIEAADGSSEGVLQTLVSGNFFKAVGVSPALGRPFELTPDESGQAGEVILSDRLWKNGFGAAPDIIGRTIRLGGENAVVIGVMPDTYDFPLGTEIWTLNALSPQERSSRVDKRLISLARLKPGKTLDQAEAEVQEVGKRLRVDYPDTNRERSFVVRPAHRFLVNHQREQYLLMLLYSAGFVLLIACANVANLQFVRAPGRLREVAVRTAMGASRWRVISQLVTESVLLSLAGGIVGLLLGNWGMSMIKAGMPSEIVRLVLGWKDIQIDYQVLLFTLAATVSSGILAGLAPAWQCSRPDLNEGLKEGGRGTSAGSSRHLVRYVLVAAEIILAVVVLVGAGLMVRGFRAQIDNGARLRPQTLLTLRLALTGSKYQAPHQRAGFYSQVLDKVGTLPGVRSAAAVTALPYSGYARFEAFVIEGRPPDSRDVPEGMVQAASPSYFATLGLELREGRLLNESDGPETQPVALISRRLATRWWSDEPPLGRRIRIGTEEQQPWLTIVGVVEDVIHSPYERVPKPTIYVSYKQAPEPWMNLAVRTVDDPLLLAPAVSAAIHQVDRQQPVAEVRSMEQAIHNSAIGLNYMAALMGVFGILALVLSVVGVYAVLAQLVSEQTRDIAMRMALGAQRLNVLLMVFRRGMLTVAVGLALGLPLAWAMSRFLASVIYGVSAGDPATFVGIPATFLAAAGFAIYIPARRATRIDPIVALRYG